MPSLEDADYSLPRSSPMRCSAVLLVCSPPPLSRGCPVRRPTCFYLNRRRRWHFSLSSSDGTLICGGSLGGAFFRPLWFLAFCRPLRNTTMALSLASCPANITGFGCDLRQWRPWRTSECPLSHTHGQPHACNTVRCLLQLAPRPMPPVSCPSCSSHLLRRLPRL